MSRYDDDEDAEQSVVGGSPFASRMGAQPWLQANGEPPWHMWGNSQRIEVDFPLGLSNFSPAVRQQLTKVAYGRPDTWHWLFTARLIDATDADPDEPLTLSITWELTVGIGRSFQQNLGFDSWTMSWGTPVTPTDVAPRGRLLWATQTYQSRLGRQIFIAPEVEPPNLIDEIVAQDIQLTVRAAMSSPVTPRTSNKRAVIEVGAQWAPKCHVRPDWFRNDEGTPLELQFPGGEVQGR